MIMKLNINDRATLSIKNSTKRVEIRANKENSEHDYSKLEVLLSLLVIILVYFMLK
ncbi:MAG: hypothetical protein ACI31S_02775 [Bacilli bacterium]